MNKQTWLNDLNTIVRSEQLFIDDDEIQHRSYDVWPVTAKWKAQGKRAHKPDAFVYSTSVKEVSNILGWTTRNKVPVTPWGLGSGVCGAPIPTHGSVSLDMSRIKRILALDETKLMVKVQGGKLGLTWKMNCISAAKR